MAQFSQNIALTDWSAEQADIERRRKLAELLQQKGMEPIEQQTAGGYVIPTSWTQGLAKALQQGLGSYQQGQLKVEQKDLGQRYQSELMNALTEGSRLEAGRPAVPSTMYEDAAGNAAPTDARSAVPPDPMGAAAAYARHPETRQMAMDTIRRQKMIEAFGLGTTSQGAPSQTGEALASNLQSPPTQQGSGMLVPRNIAMQLMLADPSGKLLAEANAKASAEANRSTDKMRQAQALGLKPGSPEYNSYIGTQFNQGGAWTPSPTGGVQLAPGYAQGMGETRAAEEAAKANLDIVEVPVGNGAKRPMTRAQAAQLLQNQSPQPMPPNAQGIEAILAGRPPAEQRAIQQVMQAQQQGRPMSVDVGAYDPSKQVPYGPIPSSDVIARTPTTAEQSFQSSLGETQGKSIEDGFKAAQDASQIIQTVNEGKRLLDSGMITGFGANFMTSAGNALKQAGIDYGGNAVSNTQTYTANMAQNVGKLIKQFGAGTGLSDADRVYAEKMAGGHITLDAKALRNILDINEKAARNVIQNHNKRASSVQSQLPLTVPEPPAYQSQPRATSGSSGGWSVVR